MISRDDMRSLVVGAAFAGVVSLLLGLVADIGAMNGDMRYNTRLLEEQLLSQKIARGRMTLEVDKLERVEAKYAELLGRVEEKCVGILAD